ncbi:hypothetical protein ACUXQ2_003706 [Cupriavidus metallidurans]
MILASLRGLAVLLVLSAAARLARTASLHFDSASYTVVLMRFHGGFMVVASWARCRGASECRAVDRECVGLGDLARIVDQQACLQHGIAGQTA